MRKQATSSPKPNDMPSSAFTPRASSVQQREEQLAQITELAGLMNEFQLTKARFEVGDFSVAFRKTPKQRPVRTVRAPGESLEDTLIEESVDAIPEVVVPLGTPVASPMTGIYYASPNPSSPPFVKEGEEVIAGQTIGLIEAMKVFNEIPSPVSGTVKSLKAASGDLVQNGDVLLYIG
jgi:acetyl-CoA carboxylase biotin carboxyl carrier protein